MSETTTPKQQIIDRLRQELKIVMQDLGDMEARVQRHLDDIDRLQGHKSDLIHQQAILNDTIRLVEEQ